MCQLLSGIVCGAYVNSRQWYSVWRYFSSSSLSSRGLFHSCATDVTTTAILCMFFFSFLLYYSCKSNRNTCIGAVFSSPCTTAATTDTRHTHMYKSMKCGCRTLRAHIYLYCLFKFTDSWHCVVILLFFHFHTLPDSRSSNDVWVRVAKSRNTANNKRSRLNHLGIFFEW